MATYIERKIACAIRIKDWLDDRVSEVFTDYCEIFGIQRAYGVENYHLNSSVLVITQDITSYSCHDTEDHILPIEYLYLEGEDRRVLMMQHAEEKRQSVEKQKKQILLARVKHHQAEIERLTTQIANKES